MKRYYCQNCGDPFSENDLDRNMYCSKSCSNGEENPESSNQNNKNSGEIPYSYETELVWKKDPENLKYLREIELDTRKNKGIPHSKFRDNIVYGWTNVEENAPTIRHGLITKRVFYLKPGDVGSPQHKEQFKHGSPVEAVEIDSIIAGSKPEEHEVDDHLKGTKWWNF